MKFEELVDHYGTVAKISAVLADTSWPASEQAIGQWKNRIPEGRQYQFELLTGGVLKAENPEAA